MQITTKELLTHVVEGIQEKKGENIIHIDVSKLDNSITDFFVICHANSNRQVVAIADHIEKSIRKKINQAVFHREGKTNSEWILLDYINIVVHVFKKETRELYKLEELWGDGVIKEYPSE